MSLEATKVEVDGFDVIQRILFIALLNLASASNAVFGEWADNNKMVLDTLAPSAPHDSAAQKEVIELARLNIEEVARKQPNERRAATVVFSVGRSIDDIVNLSNYFDVAVVEVQLKAPLNDQGIVHTVVIGTDNLLAIDAPFADWLDHSMQFVREQMLDRAATMVDELAADEFRQMALGPQHIYSIQIVGTGRSISEVAHSPEVAAEFLHWANARVLELDSNG